MALQQLSPEQIRTWTREQKDRWWLENVFRGDMPQLTLRSAVTGFLLGGVLSATNLYVAAKTGWTLGVGLTSVILAFALYRAFSRLGARDMTILENNCVQSIATAAGYMTMPLTSGLAAYMWATNNVLPAWQIICFTIVLSILGVLVAFPMKRRFINDEQHPFPEGRACGVVLDALYERAAAASGMFKAKALAAAAALAGGVGLISGENYMRLVQQHWLGLQSSWHLPTHLDGWYYALVDKGFAPLPKLAGVDIRQLALSPTLDLAMIGAGGLMGIRTGASLLLGAALNFVIVVPVMISLGEIVPRAGTIVDGTALFGRAHILNTWALWWGITMMVVASMVALFARPEVFVEAFRGLTGRGRSRAAGDDVLKDIELPLPVSWIGVPIIGAFGVWMAHDWFGVDWLLGRAVDTVDPRAGADRREQHGTHRHHALELAVEDPAVHVRRARSAHARAQPDDGRDERGGGQQRVQPADGHQAGLHARRQAAPAGDRPRHRHIRRSAGSYAVVLPAVRPDGLRSRGRTLGDGHDGDRQVHASRARCSGKASRTS